MKNKEKALFPKRNMKREHDLRLLYELLPHLSEKGILAVYFRFWENLMIEDIARILGQSWSETDKLIEGSIKELRTGFLSKKLSA